MTNKKNTPKDYNDRFKKQGYNPNKVQERVVAGDTEYNIMDGTTEEDRNTLVDFIKNNLRYIGILTVLGAMYFNTNCMQDKEVDNLQCESNISGAMIDCKKQKLENYILARCDACLDDCGEYNKNTCKDGQNK